MEMNWKEMLEGIMSQHKPAEDKFIDYFSKKLETYFKNCCSDIHFDQLREKLSSKEFIKEMVQTTFLKAIKYLREKGLRSHLALSKCVFTIAERHYLKCFDVHSKDFNLKKEYIANENNNVICIDNHNLYHGNPESILIAKQKKEIVHDIISSLKPYEQIIIKKKLWENWKNKEVSLYLSSLGIHFTAEQLKEAYRKINVKGGRKVYR
ncbi:hypothetical protein ACFL2A_04975 [Thermodesulfobacteriota bacterium]